MTLLICAFATGVVLSAILFFWVGRESGAKGERELVASFLESIVIREAHDKKLIAMFAKAVRRRGQKTLPEA